MKKPKPTEASDRAWCPVYGSMFEDVDMTEDTTYDADQGWAEENARKYKELVRETEAYFKRRYNTPSTRRWI